MIKKISKKFKEYTSFSGLDFDNYNQQIKENYKPFSNYFSYYKRFVEELSELKSNIEILPLYEFTDREKNAPPLLGIRHDIDADIITGLRCAKFLSRYGICGSFYILTTALYYGNFYGDVFIKNAFIRNYITGFIESGCEIGIHNDALRLFFDLNINGAEAFKTELAWLRSLGANIRGTVAHNSFPIYGVASSEIFKERILLAKGLRKPNDNIIGILSEAELGLTYEGTFAVPGSSPDIEHMNNMCNAKSNLSDEKWAKDFFINNPCHEYSVDYQIWIVGIDKWIISGHQNDKKIFRWDVNLLDVLSFIKQLPNGSRTICVIHPCYVGK